MSELDFENIDPVYNKDGSFDAIKTADNILEHDPSISDGIDAEKAEDKAAGMAISTDIAYRAVQYANSNENIDIDDLKKSMLDKKEDLAVYITGGKVTGENEEFFNDLTTNLYGSEEERLQSFNEIFEHYDIADNNTKLGEAARSLQEQSGETFEKSEAEISQEITSASQEAADTIKNITGTKSEIKDVTQSPTYLAAAEMAGVDPANGIKFGEFPQQNNGQTYFANPTQGYMPYAQGYMQGGQTYMPTGQAYMPAGYMAMPNYVFVPVLTTPIQAIPASGAFAYSVANQYSNQPYNQNLSTGAMENTVPQNMAIPQNVGCQKLWNDAQAQTLTDNKFTPGIDHSFNNVGSNDDGGFDEI